jgi:hypothetical protein
MYTRGTHDSKQTEKQRNSLKRRRLTLKHRNLLIYCEDWGFHFFFVFTPTSPLLWGAFCGIFGSCFTNQTRSLLRRAGYGGLGLHGRIFGVALPYYASLTLVMAKSFSAFIPSLKRWGLPAEQVKI